MHCIVTFRASSCLAARGASTENSGGAAARPDARPGQVDGAETGAAASAGRMWRVPA